MKYITVIIILILFIIYSTTDCEHMSSVTADTRIAVTDSSGNIESIGFPLLYSEIDKDPNNFKKHVPMGAIMMWSGALTTIPRGWKLCDGVGATPNDGVIVSTDFKIPDLRGRFIVGVNPAGNNKQPARNAYEMAAVGGAETHTLTVAEMPAHNHDLRMNSDYKGGWRNLGGGWDKNQGWDTINIRAAGGGQPHNNLPPYYTLAYIIKVV